MFTLSPLKIYAAKPEAVQTPLESRHILGVRVDATNYDDAAARALSWAQQGCSAYVCCAYVTTIMEARDSPDFREVITSADLVTSDGMPLVWALRRMGLPQATRVYGPDLMQVVLGRAAKDGVPVGFYGATPPIVSRIAQRATGMFPGLDIVYTEAPPFRPLTPEEDARTVEAIRESGARILFIGLSTPKQDRWMHAHRGKIPAVMLGVGAAFDFFAGTKPQAPRWMQNHGLEWLFRLATEPRRLWKRYLRHNPRFAVLAIADLLRSRFS